MKNRMSNSAPTVKEVVSQTKEESKPEQGNESSPEEKKENHPRSGNYKDEDVSIEKFFYMGNK